MNPFNSGFYRTDLLA